MGVAKITEQNAVTEEDLAASMTLRGLFTNRIYVQPGADGLTLRINFAETVGTHAVYHTAIVVPSFDALQFGELISRMAQSSIDFATTSVPSEAVEDTGDGQ